jgi:hypothetical protein
MQPQYKRGEQESEIQARGYKYGALVSGNHGGFTAPSGPQSQTLGDEADDDIKPDKLGCR